MPYSRVLSWALFAAVAAYFIFFALTRPAIDWDIAAYTMATLRDGTLGDAALHARTWAIVKSHVPESAFRALTDPDNSYRAALFASPALMISQMPLFEFKYGYVLLLKALAVFTDPLTAIVLASLAGALITLGALFFEAQKLRGIATLGWFPLVKLFDLPALASFPTPDSIATGVYAVSYCAFLADRLRSAVVLFIAGVFIRPDNLVLNVALCAAVATRSSKASAVLFVGSVAAFLFDDTVSRHIGWWRQFHYNFLGFQNDLRGFDPPFDFALYTDVVRARLVEVLHLDWPYAVIAILLLAAALLSGTRQPLAKPLLAALVGASVLRFLLYPSVESRLYGPLVFGLAIVALHAIRPHVQPAWLSRRL